jgi:hypothetical protein
VPRLDSAGALEAMDDARRVFYATYERLGFRDFAQYRMFLRPEAQPVADR